MNHVALTRYCSPYIVFQKSLAEFMFMEFLQCLADDIINWDNLFWGLNITAFCSKTLIVPSNPFHSWDLVGLWNGEVFNY